MHMVYLLMQQKTNNYEPSILYTNIAKEEPKKFPKGILFIICSW